MGHLHNHPHVARALAATAAAGMAVGLAWLSCVTAPGCGFDPRQMSAAQPTQTYNVTDLDTGDDRTLAVTPALTPPTPGVRLELTDAALASSVGAALVALLLAWTARRKANGVARSLDQWRSSPPEP